MDEILERVFSLNSWLDDTNFLLRIMEDGASQEEAVDFARCVYKANKVIKVAYTEGGIQRHLYFRKEATPFVVTPHHDTPALKEFERLCNLLGTPNLTVQHPSTISNTWVEVGLEYARQARALRIPISVSRGPKGFNVRFTRKKEEMECKSESSVPDAGGK